MRLGGHVLAGTCIVVSSLHDRGRAVQVVGAIAGIWLTGYSFVASVAPEQVLYPAGLLIVVWFGFIDATAPTTTTAGGRSPAADTASASPASVVRTVR